MPDNESKPFSLLRGIENLVGVGMHLLLLGLFLEGLTLFVRQWISFPISLTSETQVLLTVPCVAACLLGAIWFNRSLDLIRVHLLNGKTELITDGPFAYVRHPLYSTLLITIPPLLIVWLSDLLFFIPWVLMLVVSHCLVRLEEQGLIEVFGKDYERYRRYVPALLPYKGAGGQRYREDMVERTSRPVVAHVFLLRSGSVLLLRRAKTGFEDGQYGLVGGHLEGGESIKQAAIRECREEIGVEIDRADLEVVGVTHYNSPTGAGIDFFLSTSQWRGEPYPRAECDDLQRCPLNALPENTIPFVRRAIDRHLRLGLCFDEIGWEQ